MTNNCSEADYIIHMKRITERKLWELVEIGREDVNNIGVKNEIMEYDKTEYSSLALAEVVDGENRIDWILVTRSRVGK